MANSNGLAVGLAVGIPSLLIILVVLIFWYKNHKKLQKEDIDDEFIEKELQNDQSSFKQFHEQLHRKYHNENENIIKGKNGDDIQFKENIIVDSSIGSSESDFPSNTSSSTTNKLQQPQQQQTQQTQQSQQSQQPQHPYGQHLKLPQYPSTQNSQTLSQIHPTYYHQNSYSQHQSSYDFYDTFIPTFTNNDMIDSSNGFPQQQQSHQQHHSNHPHLNHLNPLGNFFSSSNSNSNSKTNSFIDLPNSSENINNRQNLQEFNSQSSLLNNTHNNNSSQSQPHTRSSSTDLDTLAKQLNNPIYFEKLPSKIAAQQQNSFFIKPRYPSTTLKNNKSSSSELINNYLIGENSAINDHFTYDAPIIENKQQFKEQVKEDNALKDKEVKEQGGNKEKEKEQIKEQEIIEEKISKNPLNNQIDNSFDSKIKLNPTPINNISNDITNKEKDIIPPVIFQ
ncbi:SKG1 [Candida pseudojiufengensis]|uniref:SKG1 n=1 Tax=Candida pseudojiufengensis TaxID=497109 RepID=UPI002224C285|nr:SKG1 [Candida pseudojiufengensis]KAI5965797.1 SKG1 [Candida pseudojiufengensis]